MVLGEVYFVDNLLRSEMVNVGPPKGVEHNIKHTVSVQNIKVLKTEKNYSRPKL